METTKLSSKGQVIIPKGFRVAHRWEAGLELVAIEVGDGILLKPKVPFEETALDEVAGCLRFEGKAKSIEEIDQAIRQHVTKEWRDSD
ncbi:AbrB/MazE/SpoVT family DNA-binding domain-containing protein [Methylocaldum sp.]|uniref:AbrB/MazE/SpoVT family DNA-binding domain-containing protein n=1 Tax=Methylocaldum sp. TaxID=1969727 RepID=UPI002D422617|nr:AbrB/MazE/SpoVT family DNA-binding domain-containing protein [Methylocaldum sp.]HYE36858.1 AbrB/MazE/SpoVT family DNA-binding domain-containing protein [Methylocaldum sp.]